MRNYVVGGVYALASAFVGMLLPMVSAVGPIHRPTNLPLGFVYGFGWYVWGLAQGLRSPNAQLFGSLIWPVIVMLAITYFFGRSLSNYSGRKPAIIVGSVVLLFLIIPGGLVARTPLRYVPIYSTILFIVY
jgi:hypothetical protein